MIVCSNAIALKIMPFSETSRVVIWLTKEYGKIPSLIKGSQRLKSFFLGQYDLFYKCELLYYQRTHYGLHVVKELYCEKSREFLRKNWRATACVSYLASLTNRILPYYIPHSWLFDFIDYVIESFEVVPVAKYEPFLCWVEMKLLKELGFKPRFDLCALCGKKAEISSFLRNNFSSNGIPFSYKDGGVLCPMCVNRADGVKLFVPPDAFALLSNWNNSRNINSVLSVNCQPKQLEVISTLIDKFIAFHLEQTGYNRSIARDILNWKN